MPELPEVEAVSELAPVLEGALWRAWCCGGQSAAWFPPDFDRRIAGATVLRPAARNALLADLSSRDALMHWHVRLVRIGFCDHVPGARSSSSTCRRAGPSFSTIRVASA
jgi:formamidopyrimidine-DNA glycosylase